jgi:integrase
VGKLEALDVNRLSDGVHADGDGLFLQVRGNARSWILRYSIAGKSKYLGLGSTSTVSLKQARLDAGAKRREIDAARKGERGAIDPIEERQQARQAKKAAKAIVNKTFGEAAKAYIEAHGSKWSNAKHAWQWGQTLERAYKVFGDVFVRDVTRAQILDVLKPIWKKYPETASRLRGRIETVLDFADANGWREEGTNPARFRPISMALGDQDKVIRPRPSIPYQQMPEFMRDLRSRDMMSARALELQILCTTRGRETVDAEWSEIDWKAKTWTVPASRMKGRKGKRREHVVPLSSAALDLLRKLDAEQRSGPAIFGVGVAAVEKLVKTMNADRQRQGRPQYVDPKQDNRPAVPHGLARATFRTWAFEQRPDVPREIAEMCLAHTIGSDVERAYQRSDGRDMRRELMQSWANHCGPAPDGNVVSLRK